ncbi:MAG: large repetitive protein, partial [Acidobacteriota bacterium]|nr:large repetitive protein [Acidobacteriota bacterium]
MRRETFRISMFILVSLAVCLPAVTLAAAPIAFNDSYSTPQDTVLNVPAPGVFANDYDPDGDPFAGLAIPDQPDHGTLNTNSNGSFTYTPNAGFSGTDSFQYVGFAQGAASNTATVTITVNADNQAPVANNDSYSTPQNTTLTIAAPGVLANDSDPDGDTLYLPSTTQPAHGTLVAQALGNFTYTPNPGFSGTDSFQYEAFDVALLSNMATVTITVNANNQPPVANNDSYSTPQNTPLTIA